MGRLRRAVAARPTQDRQYHRRRRADARTGRIRTSFPDNVLFTATRYGLCDGKLSITIALRGRRTSMGDGEPTERTLLAGLDAAYHVVTHRVPGIGRISRAPFVIGSVGPPRHRLPSSPPGDPSPPSGGRTSGMFNGIDFPRSHRTDTVRSPTLGGIRAVGVLPSDGIVESRPEWARLRPELDGSRQLDGTATTLARFDVAAEERLGRPSVVDAAERRSSPRPTNATRTAVDGVTVERWSAKLELPEQP